MPTPSPDRLMTETQVVIYLIERGVPASRPHLYRDPTRQPLAAYKFGRSLRYSLTDIEAWVVSHRAGPSHELPTDFPQTQPAPQKRR